MPLFIEVIQTAIDDTTLWPVRYRGGISVSVEEYKSFVLVDVPKACSDIITSAGQYSSSQFELFHHASTAMWSEQAKQWFADWKTAVEAGPHGRIMGIAGTEEYDQIDPFQFNGGPLTRYVHYVLVEVRNLASNPNIAPERYYAPITRFTDDFLARWKAKDVSVKLMPPTFAQDAGSVEGRPFDFAWGEVFILCLAGLPEEFCKYFTFRGAAYRSTVLDPSAILAYGIIAGFMFGCIENFTYFIKLDAALRAGRTLPMVLHICWATISAGRLAESRFLGKKRNAWSVVWPSMLLHCMNNTLAVFFSVWAQNWMSPSTCVIVMYSCIGVNALVTFILARFYISKLSQLPQINIRTVIETGQIRARSCCQFIYDSFGCCGPMGCFGGLGS
jgi:hypothetical protein